MEKDFSRYRLRAAGWRVMVRVVETQEKKTKSGLVLLDDTVDKENLSNTVGQIVDVNPIAFKDRGGPEAWGAKVGTYVLFTKQGTRVVEYPGYNSEENGILRVLNDDDIIAFFEEVDDES